MRYVTESLFEQAVAERRDLHMIPEIDFDLDRTSAYVRRALAEAGIPHTDRYCRNSVCGFLGDHSGKVPIIALRADMDALSVQEATGLPYASRIPGRMHACGHDSHTAVLLAVGRLLKAREDELPCGVKLIFQPAEEGEISGAEQMVKNGVLDDVACVLGAHCENTLPVGRVGIHDGAYMAACAPIVITFHGHSAHAALPAGGIDAIAMGVKAYDAMKRAVAEEAGGTPYIWSVGRIEGGTAHNVIADTCRMNITFRYYDESFAGRAQAKVEALCAEIAEAVGGSVEVDWHVSAHAVINDSGVVTRFRHAATASALPLEELPSRMSSEDFSWYLTRCPGAIFRFGTRNEALGCTALAHRPDFKIDEAGMRVAIEAFAAFVLDGLFHGPSFGEEGAVHPRREP